MLTFNAVHRLIKAGDITSLQRQLDAGLSPSLSNQRSWTLLMLAALKGNVGIGELLISRGAEVNASNDFGETALSLAAHRGRTRFIQLSLDGGAATDCRPHGRSLEDWLRSASGLSKDKISSMLEQIKGTKS